MPHFNGKQMIPHQLPVKGIAGEENPAHVTLTSNKKIIIMLKSRYTLKVFQLDQQLVLRTGTHYPVKFLESEPKLATQITEPVPIFGPVTVEVNRTVVPLLEDDPIVTVRQLLEHGLQFVPQKFDALIDVKLQVHHLQSHLGGVESGLGDHCDEILRTDWSVLEGGHFLPLLHWGCFETTEQMTMAEAEKRNPPENEAV
uniref:Uncharacterized protein n=1 Tax=Anopheles culicifacies TaxID=139723 RepID=A0A182MEX7_9DIPT